jgi:hypothetical protein
LDKSLEIRETGDRLVFKTAQARTSLQALFAVVIGVVFAYLAFHRFVGRLALVLVSLIAGLIGLFEILRSSKAELRVTERSLESSGFFAERLFKSKILHWSQVQWLEFQGDTTGPETSHHPGGLYAILQRGSVCILPYIDEKQTSEAIDRILRKFPHLQEQWRGKSAFGNNFTTLGL